jgi:hypothetical protein
MIQQYNTLFRQFSKLALSLLLIPKIMLMFKLDVRVWRHLPLIGVCDMVIGLDTSWFTSVILFNQ